MRGKNVDFAKRTQFLRLLCGFPWFMRMPHAQLFWRFFAKQTPFRLHFLSQLNRSYATRKIVIPNGRPGSGIGAYGKWKISPCPHRRYAPPPPHAWEENKV